MTIAVLYGPPAMTMEDYRASWEAGPPVSPPAGLLFHAGLGEGDDFTTVSIWQSREAYDAFAPTFTRAMAELGFDFGTPRIVPVHHFQAPDRWG